MRGAAVAVGTGRVRPAATAGAEGVGAALLVAGAGTVAGLVTSSSPHPLSATSITAATTHLCAIMRPDPSRGGAAKRRLAHRRGKRPPGG
ncbi:hypothetical protein Adi01nite_17630 [Amorphoplanes digitatis]|nr:hypothetical protein GCM10020092_046760 [Actinoplanes digitatis]GID92351.1 hypothetical protein Adi01nite_17630 [Actinoplanes digitatis]